MRIPYNNKDIVYTERKGILMPRKPRMICQACPVMLFNVALIEILASSKKTIIGSCWIA
jgi:hypothetical protein